MILVFVYEKYWAPMGIEILRGLILSFTIGYLFNKPMIDNYCLMKQGNSPWQQISLIYNSTSYAVTAGKKNVLK